MEPADTGRRAARGVAAALVLIALTYASSRSDIWIVPAAIVGAALSAIIVQSATPAVAVVICAATAGLLMAGGLSSGETTWAILRTQIPGMTMGLLIRQGYPPLAAILGGVAPLFAPELTHLVVTQGADLLRQDSAFVDEVVSAAHAYYQKLAIPEDQLVKSEKFLREALLFGRSISPALWFMFLVGLFLMVYFFCQSFFARLGFSIRPVEHFPTWRLSHWYAWLFVLGLVALLLPGAPLHVAGYNLIVVMAAAYFVQGLSVTQFLMIRRRLGLAMRMLIYSAAVVAIPPFFAAMTTGIGLFDTWFDFRGLEPRESPPDSDREGESEEDR